MKSEPESYSWSDLVRDKGTEWDGVRNNAARLHLKAMKKGDEAFFYHSMSDKAVVGIMRVTREAQPDPKDSDWVSVRVEPVRALERPVTLAEIKAEPSLAKMELIRQSTTNGRPSSRWREGDDYAASSLRASRLRSCGSRKRFRMRIALGVTSTNSSS